MIDTEILPDQDHKHYGLIVKKEFADRHPDLIKKIKDLIENAIDSDSLIANSENNSVSDSIGSLSGNSESSGTTSIKPPIGIIPRRFWEEQRIHGLMETISQYTSQGKLVKEEWVDELNDLLYSRTEREP